MQHQALSRIFVHQRQPVEWTPCRGPIVDKVIGPNVVLAQGRLLNTTVGLRPGFRTEFPAFLSLKGPRSPRPFQSRRTRLELTG